MNPVDAVAGQISLLGPIFLALSAIAILTMRATAPGLLRQAALLTQNCCFLLIVTHEIAGLLITIVMVHVAFALSWWNRRDPDHYPHSLTLIAIALYWALLLTFKNSDAFFANSAMSQQMLEVVGVSYLSFRAISTINDAVDLDDFDYLTFVNYMIFFPTLLAGPIERYDQFNEDTRRPELSDLDTTLAVLRRITQGFVKKFVIADNFGAWGIFAFGVAPETSPVSMLWLGTLLQLALIYLDFSGYCDIVIGVARLMGWRIQENFDRPYFSANIQDFWNRWHMSLTFFVRDYVFTPVCKFIFQRVPRKKQFPYVVGAYFFTMIVIALWHKLSVGFLLFGVMHGLALVFLQLKRKYLDKSALGLSAVGSVVLKPPLPVSAALTWVFFAISTYVWYFPPATSLAITRRLFLLG